MNPSSWEGSQTMLNQRDMSGMRQSQGTRSQDDANVGYLYQRSHSDVPVGGGFPHKRWALGDDSMLEQSRQMTSVQELERQFQGLAMSQAPGSRPEMSHQSKKLWDDDHKVGDGQPKSFLPWGSREDAWTNVPSDASNQIGMNMVEYVLGVSPNKMEPGGLSRMKPFTQYPSQQIPQQEGEDKKSKTPSPFEDRTGDDSKDQANGMMANGLDDGGFRGSRQTSPADEERQGPVGMSMDPKLHMRDGADFMDNTQGFGLDSHQQQQQFDQVNLQYGTDFGSQMMPSMESPNNFNMDYNQQLLQRQQQPIAMLTPQQPFTLPGQQPLGVAGPNPMSQGPYVLAQDPYVAAGVPFAGQHKNPPHLPHSPPTVFPFSDNANLPV
ncbi:pumilio homolog 1-like [Plakobranchus ocellatus]|uniref:Pumilio homolog 1-like n=1 Tax=Plakobranchus ocellatus TaxID=259542 RepID=A0AAV4ABG5_9GAST|nr:pumilio homolog 1-like [Plakobranchus ocellatus]